MRVTLKDGSSGYVNGDTLYRVHNNGEREAIAMAYVAVDHALSAEQASKLFADYIQSTH